MTLDTTSGSAPRGRLFTIPHGVSVHSTTIFPNTNREYGELADNGPKLDRTVDTIVPQAGDTATLATIGSAVGGVIASCVIFALTATIHNFVSHLKEIADRISAMERRISANRHNMDTIEYGDDVSQISPHSEQIGIGSTPRTENVRFHDYNEGFRYTVGSEYDPVRDHALADDATLDNFFSRPLKLKELQWNVGSPLLEPEFNPWSLYFENKRVINRINNYKLLRCKLHLKFVINGTQFHYGRLMASYRPHPVSDNFPNVLPDRKSVV